MQQFWEWHSRFCRTLVLTLLFLLPSTLPAQAPGTLAGQFHVNEAGGASYEVPLAIPPGTGGLAPSLGLVYSSSSPSALLGPGWSLAGLSAISRCAANIPTDGYLGGVALASSDRFCLDGQRLVAIAGSYGADGTEYRTQLETFSRIISHGQSGNGPAYFTVQTKDGRTLELGGTPDARLLSSSSTVLSWSLNRVQDRLGNYYTVSYFQDPATGFTAPSVIQYTGNSAAGLVPYNQVVVEYEGRTYAKEAFVGGERFAIFHRIRKISTYSDGVPSRSYAMAYDHDPISHEDRLLSVRACDGQGVCLPPTTFTWGVGGSGWQGFVPGQTFNNLSTAQGLWSNYHYPIFVGDWNGDGLSDLARVQLNGTLTCLNSATGFAACQTLQDFGQQSWPETNSKPMVLGDWSGTGRTGFARSSGYEIASYVANATGATFSQLPHLYDLSSQQGYNDQVRDPLFVGDWNGDGRSDLARGHLGSHIFTLAFDPSTGAGFQTQAITPLVVPDLYNYYPYVFTGDWNGDGITDLGLTWEEKPVGANRILFYRGTGTGFALMQDMPQPVLSPGDESFSSDTETILTGDWNGDGLTDFGISGFSGIKFYRSTGTSLVFWYELPDLGRDQVSGSSGASIGDYPFETGDWNGDGRTDIARVTASAIRFYTAQATGFEFLTSLSDLSPAQGFSNNDTRPLISGDWNGDGFTDIGRVSANGVVMYVHAFSASTQIIAVTDGLGKRIEIEYGRLTDPGLYTKGTAAAYPLVDLQMAGEVVAAVRSSTGLGGFSTELYHYSGLMFDSQRRDSKGFATVDAFDATTGITTTSFYHQAFPYEGRIYRQERRLQNGTLISRSNDTWSSLAGPAGTLFPFSSQTVDEQFEITGAPVLSVTTTRTVDSYGNPTQTSITRSDGSSEVTTASYTNSVASWTLGQLTQTTVTKVGGGTTPPPAITRSTAFSYLPTSGLLQTETIEPSTPSQRITKTYTYDAFGNRLSTTTSGPSFTTRVRSTQFDARGRYPTQSTNVLNQSEAAQFDALTGLARSKTDANGLTIQWTYDGFGRVLQENRPDGTATQTTYEWPDPLAPSNAAYVVRTTTTGGPTMRVYLDVLGREIQARTVGFGGKEIVVDKVYNERGELILVSEPYFVGDAILWNASDYDALGRVTRVTAPGNIQTTTAYSGLTTTVTNALGQTRTETVDAQGQTFTVTDYLGNVLRFVRDSYGNPTQVIDPAGNVTTMAYAPTGQRTMIDDPDAGVTTSTYNALGELLSVTNAKNETITYSYDLLGRLLTRVSPEGTESWVYDTAANGIGKLSQVMGLHGYAEQYIYDALGRRSQTVTTVGATPFTFGQSYDALGRLDVLTYPTGYALKHLYNGAGYLVALQEQPSRSVIWKAVTRNARGQLEQQAFGNGLLTTQQFHPDTGHVVHIKTGGVQDLTFQFDALGNLQQRQDLRTGRSESFGYDGLNRLISSQVSGATPVLVTYDATGNVTSRSDVGTFHYPAGGSARPHAVTSITGTRPNSYGYDAAGNRTSSVGGSVTYSSSGKPTVIVDQSSRVEFDLDPADQRVEERRIEGGVLTERKLFIGGGLFERVERGVTTALVHYIRSSEGLVAQMTTTQVTKPGRPPVSTSAMRYLHLDHLGSIQTITDAKGLIVEVQSYDSWGNRRDPVTWAPAATAIQSRVDRGFTGHEHLESVNLIHMNGRVYDPAVGRFISADPYVQSPSDLQSYNRYSYVLNNPLSLTDPTGYFSFRKFRKMVMRSARMVIRQIAVSAAIAAGSAIGGPYAGPFLAAYLGNFTKSLVNGGSLSQSYHAGFRHLLVNAAHAQVDYLIGHGIDGKGGFSNYGSLGLALAHGAADAGYAAATGGNVRSAFFSGVGGSLGADIGKLAGGSYIGASIGGGVGAKLSGGSFAEGAMRGAFIYLYNHAAGDGYSCDASGHCALHVTIRPLAQIASSGGGGSSLFSSVEQLGAWMSEHGDSFGIASRALEDTARGFEDTWATNRITGLFTPLITTPLYGMAALSEALRIVARPPTTVGGLYDRVVRMYDLRKSAVDSSEGIDRVRKWHRFLND